MPISLFLSDQQMDILTTATKGKDIQFKTLGHSTVHLTAENWEAIRDAVTELHSQKFKIKTKTIDHMETCFFAQQILGKIKTLEGDLQRIPPVNDNASIVPVETSSEVPVPETEEEAVVATTEVQATDEVISSTENEKPNGRTRRN